MTMPVVAPTETGFDVLPQLPPGVPSLSVIVAPAHTVDGPVIADGAEFTATVTIRLQPDAIA